MTTTNPVQTTLRSPSNTEDGNPDYGQENFRDDENFTSNSSGTDYLDSDYDANPREEKKDFFSITDDSEESSVKADDDKKADKEDKRNTVEESITVNVPISTAYNQWTQFESFPSFMGAIDEIEQLDKSRTHWKVTIAGVTREFDAEITEQHPDERIAWNSIDGPDHAGVVTFHRLNDDSTKIMLQLSWHPTGFVEKAGAVLGADDLQIRNDLRRFKDLIESNGFESGAWRGDIARPDAKSEEKEPILIT